MKFEILALDYDGTIARDGVLHPEVKAAISEARTRGIVVVLVTGRILADLQRAAGGIEFVDGVVAENGAVLALPNGHTRIFGGPPPAAFLEEVRRRRVEFGVGECVVEADANSAPQILSVIRELELPLVVLFNRGRLMVLPQGIRDHDLLSACEIAVAVSWGSIALQKQANEVIQGDGPPAVAAYIRRVIQSTRLPYDRIGRHGSPWGRRKMARMSVSPSTGVTFSSSAIPTPANPGPAALHANR